MTESSALVGHEGPRRLLATLIVHRRVPTGVLLFGDRGRGKRRLAEDWAAALLCEAPREGFACAACRSCGLGAAARHPDLDCIERVEGKTLISIDQVRELQKRFALAPYHAQRRVAIIDEAELLTVEAQNALLKLLEEPPGAGVLIVVSSSAASLLETIVSRLQRIHLGPLGEEAYAELARRSGTDEARAAAALAFAAGSFGKAMDLLEEGGLDQLLAWAEIFFDPGRGPYAFSSALFSDLPRGAAAQASRERLDRFLDVGLELARRSLHLGAGRPQAEGIIPIPPALEGLGTSAAAELIETLVLAGERRRANVSPKLVAEAAKIRATRLMLGAR